MQPETKLGQVSFRTDRAFVIGSIKNDKVYLIGVEWTVKSCRWESTDECISLPISYWFDACRVNEVVELACIWGKWNSTSTIDMLSQPMQGIFIPRTYGPTVHTFILDEWFNQTFSHFAHRIRVVSDYLFICLFIFVIR